jgi:hypothetical protein
MARSPDAWDARCFTSRSIDPPHSTRRATSRTWLSASPLCPRAPSDQVGCFAAGKEALGSASHAPIVRASRLRRSSVCAPSQGRYDRTNLSTHRPYFLRHLQIREDSSLLEISLRFVGCGDKSEMERSVALAITCDGNFTAHRCDKIACDGQP